MRHMVITSHHPLENAIKTPTSLYNKFMHHPALKHAKSCLNMPSEPDTYAAIQHTELTISIMTLIC